MKELITIALLIITFSRAESHVVTLYNQKDLNYNRTTHILITGYAGEVDDLFVATAQTKLLKIHETYPVDQIVLILAKGKKSQQAKLKNLLLSQGHSLIFENNRKLSSKNLYEHLKHFRSIKTINFVTHSAADLGIGLDRGNNRMDHDDIFFEKIGSSLTNDAYIVLHGCNTGFLTAPGISKALGRPVFGSLTGTDFQRLHKDGNWYFNNLRDYPSKEWASMNALSFQNPKNCSKQGGCVRMKPTNTPYRGHWGEYRAGLPYYKIFCASNVSEIACRRSLYEETFLWPSTSSILSSSIGKEEFKNVALDILCPRSKLPVLFSGCSKDVQESEFNSNITSFPFNGEEFMCNKEKCFWRSEMVRMHGYKVPNFYPTKKSKRGQIISDYSDYLQAFYEGHLN